MPSLSAEPLYKEDQFETWGYVSPSSVHVQEVFRILFGHFIHILHPFVDLVIYGSDEYLIEYMLSLSAELLINHKGD